MADEFYTNKRDNTVLPALQKRGFAIMLSKESTANFDEATGDLVDSTTKNYTVQALLLNSSKGKFNPLSLGNDGNVAGTRQKFMIEATNTPTDLDTNYKIKAKGKTYTILSVAPFEIGGVPVFYDVEVVS